MTIMDWLKQPSTLRGFAIIGSAAFGQLNPEMLDYAITVGTLAIGAVEVFRKGSQ